MKYQVTETRLNSKGDKVDVRVIISPEESIFLNLSINPIGDIIDSECENYIKVKAEQEAAKLEITQE